MSNNSKNNAEGATRAADPKLLMEAIDENVVTGKSTWEETYSDRILVPISPVTRARANKFKEALMGLIRASWSQAIAWRPVEGITSDNQHNNCVIQVIDETQ